MTVGELISKLKDIQQDYKVRCEDLGRVYDDFDIETIEIDPLLKQIVFKVA